MPSFSVMEIMPVSATPKLTPLMPTSAVRKTSRSAARAALFDYIEIFYNRQRRHTSIGGISPAEAEQQFAEKDAA